MNCSEAYEKYKHLDKVLFGGQAISFQEAVLRDLWAAVKHEALGQTRVTDVLIDGESILRQETETARLKEAL